MGTKENDLSPRERRDFAAQHLKLVYKISWVFDIKVGSSYDRDDLVSIGTLGLMRAVARFNGNNLTFPSFAAKYIRGHILHWLRDEMSLIKTPRNQDYCQISSLHNCDEFGIEFHETLTDPRDDDREIVEELLDQIAVESKPLSEFIRVTVLLKAQGLTDAQIARRIGRSAESVTRDLSRVRCLVSGIPYNKSEVRSKKLKTYQTPDRT